MTQRNQTIRPSTNDPAQTLTESGNALLAAGNIKSAIDAFARACRLRPDVAETHYNLANALRMAGDLNGALAAYDRAVNLNPKLAVALCNRGAVRRDLGDSGGSIDDLRHAVQLQPDFADSHWNLAHSLLIEGQFDDGWRELEWRWKVNSLPPMRNFATPCWNGENISGKRILLHAEQGRGDTIQFVRYGQLLAERGAKVILECRADLVRLLTRCPGIGQVIATGDPLPDFDVHVPMISCPGMFQSDMRSIPAKMPYINADPTEVERWDRRMQPRGKNLRVGLSWAGRPENSNDRRRSMSLATLARLANISGVEFYSLQKGDPARQPPPPGMNMIDLTADLRDFFDTAALIANLNLVIAVDTAVAHLAGAMGKMTWLMLSRAAHWVWLLRRQDSPWYPSMRLFRQKSLGDWEFVVQSVASRLQSAASGGKL